MVSIMIEIEIDWEVTEPFVKLMYEACKHPYTLYNEGKCTLEEIRAVLDKAADTHMFHNYKRIGFLKIYFNGDLVGLSMPREILEVEHKAWTPATDNTYYRMGMIYLDEDYRGLGIGKEASLKFKEWFNYMIWTCDPANEASKLLAKNLGLSYRNNIYYDADKNWSHNEYEIKDYVRSIEVWTN